MLGDWSSWLDETDQSIEDVEDADNSLSSTTLGKSILVWIETGCVRFVDMAVDVKGGLEGGGGRCGSEQAAQGVVRGRA